MGIFRDGAVPTVVEEITIPEEPEIEEPLLIDNMINTKSNGYETKIRINDQKLVNIREEHNGVILSDYNYTHEQFITSILESVERQVLTTPLLPRGCIMYTTINKNRHYLFVEVAPQVRKVFYNTVCFDDVPFPRLLFGFSLMEHYEQIRVENVYVAALEDFVLQENTRVYYYPFTNVYQSGRVCWGNTKLPLLNSISEIRVVIELFFNSINNDDLYGGANLSKLSFRELLQSIQNKDFPVEYLNFTGKTLADWIDQFKDN